MEVIQLDWHTARAIAYPGARLRDTVRSDLGLVSSADNKGAAPSGLGLVGCVFEGFTLVPNP